MNVKLTFYGWPDNDPPGNSIAYPGLGLSSHQGAGGTGTYDDPITVAVITQSNNGFWSPGTMMYLPSLQKYPLSRMSAHPVRRLKSMSG